MTDYAGVTWLFNLKAIELENVAPILLTIDVKSLENPLIYRMLKAKKLWIL